jgi:hypothetical protein
MQRKLIIEEFRQARTKVQRCKQPKFERQALLAQNPMLGGRTSLFVVNVFNWNVSIVLFVLTY